MPQPDCSPIGAAALHTTVTMPAAASHHAMHIDLGRYSQRRRASRRLLRQQTARHAMTQHDCSPIGAAAVHTTVTLPAAANGRCTSAAAFAAAPSPLSAAPDMRCNQQLFQPANVSHEICDYAAAGPAGDHRSFWPGTSGAGSVSTASPSHFASIPPEICVWAAFRQHLASDM